MIMAIDPGTTETGIVFMKETLEIMSKDLAINSKVLEYIRLFTPEDNVTVVCEMITSYGMPVGKTTMDTLVFIGMIYNACVERGIKIRLISRFNIKMTLCGSARAKDKNIVQACKNHYSPTGGGKDKYKGTKAKPGPLYGFKSHIFSALAVGIAFTKGAELYELSET